MKSEAELRQVLADLEELDRHRTYGGKILFFQPYAKQKQFLDLGRDKRERLFLAGNQNGKSIAGAFECACHLTGIYPHWWRGREFKNSTRGWITGETGEVVRNVAQQQLFGTPGVDAAWGTGMIPKALLLDRSLSSGTRDLVDTVQVRHVSGGVSTVATKTYGEGRRKFQGEGLDFLWFDEEPPEDIYLEGLTRTTASDGVVFVTFTPINGPTSVVNRFLDEPSPSRATVTMVIEEALHIGPLKRAEMIASWPAYMREARAHGVPMLGSGRIFQTAEEMISEPAIATVPPYWYKIWGIDIGIGHPFAAVLLLWDRDADCVHVHHCIRVSDALPVVHAAAMKPYAAEVPVAYPKDAGDRDHGTGVPVAKLYKAAGLKMLEAHATWPDGGYSTEAGIMEWDERERTGRLKVASHLSEWFEERRMYHRKDGQIMKIKDDLMSATRVALMMKRFARQVSLGGYVRSAPPFNDGLATGIDFQLT